MPPPLIKSGTIGVRRIAASGGASKSVARSGASDSSRTADASHPSVRSPSAAVRHPAAKDSRFRAPRTAAVLVKCAESAVKSKSSYVDVMRLAREKISLEELNIANTRIRRVQAGGLLIEISGDDETGAKALVGRRRDVFAVSDFKDDVNVVRSIRWAEIRLIDIDQSATAEEVAAAVSASGRVSCRRN